MTTKRAKKTAVQSSVAWGVILASGRAPDFGGDIDTVFLTLGSKPVLTYSLSAFERCPEIEGLVLVTAKERLESLRAMVHMFGCNKVKSIIAAPPAREAAVLAGVDVATENGAGIITVHDGARPGVTPELISETVRVARKQGAAAVARPSTDPVYEAAKGVKVTAAMDAGTTWTLVSPQSFKTDLLHRALTNAIKKKLHPQDEADAVVALKHDVFLVPTKRPMVRIASPLDLNWSEFLLRH